MSYGRMGGSKRDVSSDELLFMTAMQAEGKQTDRQIAPTYVARPREEFRSRSRQTGRNFEYFCMHISIIFYGDRETYPSNSCWLYVRPSKLVTGCFIHFGRVSFTSESIDTFFFNPADPRGITYGGLSGIPTQF